MGLPQIPFLPLPDPSKKGLLKWVDTSGATQTLDAVVTSASDERVAEVTSHPVENGATITDHVIQQPDRLTLEFVQSDTPIEIRPGFSKKKLEIKLNPNSFKPKGLLLLTRGAGELVGAAVSAVTGLLGVSGPGEKTFSTLQASSRKEIVNDLHTSLIQLKQSPPDGGVSVSVGGRNYDRYFITRVTKTLTGATGNLARFSVDLVQVRLVATASAELPNPILQVAKEKKSLASAAAKAVSKSDVENNNSLGYDALGLGG